MPELDELDKKLHKAVSFLDYKDFKSLVKQGADPFSILEKNGKDIPTRLEDLSHSELKNNRDFGIKASKFLLRHEIRKTKSRIDDSKTLTQLPKNDYKVGTSLLLRHDSEFDKTSESEASNLSYSESESDNESQKKIQATLYKEDALDMGYSSSDSESEDYNKTLLKQPSEDSIDYTYSSSDSESEELPSMVEKLGISKPPSSYVEKEQHKENNNKDLGLPPLPPR